MTLTAQQNFPYLETYFRTSGRCLTVDLLWLLKSRPLKNNQHDLKDIQKALYLLGFPLENWHGIGVRTLAGRYRRTLLGPLSVSHIKQHHPTMWKKIRSCTLPIHQSIFDQVTKTVDSKQIQWCPVKMLTKNLNIEPSPTKHLLRDLLPSLQEHTESLIPKFRAAMLDNYGPEEKNWTFVLPSQECADSGDSSDEDTENVQFQSQQTSVQDHLQHQSNTTTQKSSTSTCTQSYVQTKVHVQGQTPHHKDKPSTSSSTDAYAQSHPHSHEHQLHNQPTASSTNAPNLSQSNSRPKTQNQEQLPSPGTPTSTLRSQNSSPTPSENSPPQTPTSKQLDILLNTLYTDTLAESVAWNTTVTFLPALQTRSGAAAPMTDIMNQMWALCRPSQITEPSPVVTIMGPAKLESNASSRGILELLGAPTIQNQIVLHTDSIQSNYRISDFQIAPTTGLLTASNVKKQIPVICT